MTGYCTNVHAGVDDTQMRANLERYTCRVKALAGGDEAMGVGLWLSARSARQLIESQGVAELGAWLRQRGLIPFTINGFPFGDFHQEVVKHRVYEPRWDEPARFSYTMDLAAILAVLLEERSDGGISTLPLGWRAAMEPSQVARAAEQLVQMAEQLARIEAESGKLIHLDLEPEPGCYLDTSEDVVRFFEAHLLPRGDEAIIRRHLRVCHDICHAAVMFEDQAAVLSRYRAADIAVGKVQVSNAVQARFGAMTDAAQRRNAMTQLRGFDEKRYLHQTMIRDDASGGTTFYEDLDVALRRGRDAGTWRTHFHVPLYVPSFGALETTMSETLACLREVAAHGDCADFEAETYAWGVLPPELACDDLAAGIARELDWLKQQMRAVGLAA